MWCANCKETQEKNKRLRELVDNIKGIMGYVPARESDKLVEIQRVLVKFDEATGKGDIK